MIKFNKNIYKTISLKKGNVIHNISFSRSLKENWLSLAAQIQQANVAHILNRQHAEGSKGQE